MFVQPLLSICIPTYNRSRYLDCLLEVFLKTSEKLKLEMEKVEQALKEIDQKEIL